MTRFLFTILILFSVSYYFYERQTDSLIQKPSPHQKSIETLNVEKTLSIAYTAYNEGGLSSLAALSKKCHRSIQASHKDYTDNMSCIAIDIFGQVIDHHMATEFGFPQDEYFHTMMVDVRIADLSLSSKSSKHSPPVFGKLTSVKKIIDEFISKKFGPIKYVSGEKIRLFVPVSMNLLKKSGHNGLKKYSQLMYRELHTNKNVTLAMLEKCAAIDMTGEFYSSRKPGTISDTYFTPKATILRIAPYFIELGYSMDESNQYLREWEQKVLETLQEPDQAMLEVYKKYFYEEEQPTLH